MKIHIDIKQEEIAFPQRVLRISRLHSDTMEFIKFLA
jgi:hypothetical protein